MHPPAVSARTITPTPSDAPGNLRAAPLHATAATAPARARLSSTCSTSSFAARSAATHAFSMRRACTSGAPPAAYAHTATRVTGPRVTNSTARSGSAAGVTLTRTCPPPCAHETHHTHDRVTQRPSAVRR